MFAIRFELQRKNLLKNKTRSKETLAFMLEAFFLILVVKAKIMDPDYLLKTLFKKKISAAFHSFAWFKHFLDNGLIFEKKNRYRNEKKELQNRAKQNMNG